MHGNRIEYHKPSKCIAFAWRLTTHTNSGVDTYGFQIKIAVWNHLNFEVQQHIRFICNLSENINQVTNLQLK